MFYKNHKKKAHLFIFFSWGMQKGIKIYCLLCARNFTYIVSQWFWWVDIIINIYFIAKDTEAQSR